MSQREACEFTETFNGSLRKARLNAREYRTAFAPVFGFDSFSKPSRSSAVEGRTVRKKSALRSIGFATSGTLVSESFRSHKAHRAHVFSFIAAPDHLLNLREPDLEDLSQDLLGRLELQGLWIAMHHGPLLWTD